MWSPLCKLCLNSFHATVRLGPDRVSILWTQFSAAALKGVRPRVNEVTPLMRARRYINSSRFLDRTWNDYTCTPRNDGGTAWAEKWSPGHDI